MSSSNTTLVGQYTTTTATKYIPEQTIGFKATGLKPSTRLAVFFDGKPITSYCAPASIDSTILTPKASDYHEIAAKGSPLKTDASGDLVGIFYVPKNKFTVGTKLFELFNYDSDTDNDPDDPNERNELELEGLISTDAYTYFRSFNHSTIDSENGALISTIPSGSSTSYILSTRGSGTSTSIDPNKPRFEPLCQTFYVGSDLTKGKDGIYLKAVDLYFASKNSTQSVTIDIRTVEKNIPTTTIMPHSTVTVKPSNVNVSATGSAYTRITFNTPVYLRAGYSYAIGVSPGGQVPGYKLITSVVGSKDLIDITKKASANWGQGILYTSTTGSTWTAVTNETLKFTLYTTQDNYANSGIATFVNEDYEFLTYSKTNSIPFNVGEYVYQMPQPLPGYVSVNAASNSISYNVAASDTLTCNLAATYAVGDSILVVGSGSTDLLRDGIYSNSFSVIVATANTDTIQFTGSAPWSSANSLFFKPATGVVSMTTGSNTVTGVGTKFTSQFSTDIPMIAAWGNSTFDGHEVLWPSNVVSQTSMTLLNAPTSTSSSAIPFNAPVGKVAAIDYNRNILILEKSTANAQSSNTAWKNLHSTTSYFAPSRILVGSISKAKALISRPVDISVNAMQPIVYSTSVQGTTINYSANTTDNTYTDIDVDSISTSSTTYFTNNEVIIASKTNEINRHGGNKSFKLNAQMTTDVAKLTPLISEQNLSVLAKSYLIGPTASREYTNKGTALAKTVTKIITLGDGNDAEDLTVYLTAYKPSGTDIQVFGKLLSASDPRPFSNKYWTPLIQTTDATLVSDTSNQSDYKEFKYELSTDPVTIPVSDLVTTNNSTVITSTKGDTTWTQLYDVGQLITIYSDASNNPSAYDVQSISAVTDTSLTLSDSISFANTSSAIIGTMIYPQAGYKNSFNNDIVRYYTADGVPHDTFNQFAIKIVMTSTVTNLVPKVADVRAIALSV